MNLLIVIYSRRLRREIAEKEKWEGEYPRSVKHEAKKKKLLY